MNNKLSYEGVIFKTLWYTVKEINYEETEKYYEVIKLIINEDKLEGNAIIKETISGTIDNWCWDNELDIWIREEN